MKNFFDFSYLKGDILGGITAGIVALPLALAFGVSSGLGPTAGLYGAMFVSFFAALFGGTSTQISGPTAPMTAVSMVVIAGILAIFDGDIEKALPAIMTIFLLTGLFQIGLGIIGLGRYIKYIPYPVVSGFMTAIGVIILITQIAPAVGYYPKEDIGYVSQFEQNAEGVILQNILEEEKEEGVLVLEDFQETLKRAKTITSDQILQESKDLAAKNASGVIGAMHLLPRSISHINWLEFILALGTIVIIYGFKRITKAVPSTLVALLVMSVIPIGLGLDYRPIEKIPGGIPMPNWEIFTEFKIGSITPYIFTALTLALLGAIDSLLTSVVADNMTKTKHHANKELIGQGIGNSIAALFGGIPGAGATIRTVVNINSGGKTRLSGMISGILLLLVLLVLGPIASKIPAAVLAGILMTVGIDVMDFKGLKSIPNMPKAEVAIMLVVLILSSVWNLVYAVGIGLVIASLMFMKKIGDLTTERSNIKILTETKEWNDEKEFPISLKEKVFIKHINGPLFFGSTNDFQSLARQIPKTASAVIIRMEKMEYIDQSGLFALEDVLNDLDSYDIKIVIIHLKKQPRALMDKIEIIPYLVPSNQIFEDFAEGVNWIKKNVKNIDS